MLSGRWLDKSKSPAGSGALQSVSARYQARLRSNSRLWLCLGQCKYYKSTLIQTKLNGRAEGNRTLRLLPAVQRFAGVAQYPHRECPPKDFKGAGQLRL
jgi:hypothetical protein